MVFSASSSSLRVSSLLLRLASAALALASSSSTSAFLSAISWSILLSRAVSASCALCASASIAACRAVSADSARFFSASTASAIAWSTPEIFMPFVLTDKYGSPAESISTFTMPSSTTRPSANSFSSIRSARLISTLSPFENVIVKIFVVLS